MSVEILRPNAAGDLTYLYQYPATGSNYEKVDEETKDDDSTYVYNEATAHYYDRYNIPNHSEGSGTINSVTVKAYMKRYVFGFDCTAKLCCKTHDTLYYSDIIQLTISYALYSKQWTTNPYTGSAWTWDEIDALLIGVGLKGEGSGYYSRCTQLWVEVNYEGAAPPSYVPRHSGVAGVLTI